MENKQLVILDGDESLLLGMIPQFSADIGDLVVVDGDVFDISDILPEFASTNPDIYGFIKNLYENITEQTIVTVDTIYKKKVLGNA